MKDQDFSEEDSRGCHTIIYPKEHDNEELSSPTIMASPVTVDISQDLPREFTNYMRALFAILDERGTGFVKLSDIEAYWDVKEGQASLPAGILGSLRKVTPRNGLLNFERLCTGFKLAIRTQRASNSNTPTKSISQRSQSLPQLAESRDKDWASDSSEDSFRIRDGSEQSELVEKWRRWRSDGLTDNRTTTAGTQSPSGMGVRKNSFTKVYFVGKDDQEIPPGKTTDNKFEGLRGGSSVNGGSKLDRDSRLKQIEEEHEILRNGMEVIEKARKWYFKRITAVQEEKLHLQQGDAKLSLEQYEMLLHKTRRTELNLDENAFAKYKANIRQLNLQLGKIIESPLKQPQYEPDDTNICRLKEELQALKKEIRVKTEQIAQLEKEKSALIRDLFNAKASQNESSKQPVVKTVASHKPPVKTTSSLKVTLPANR